MTGRDVMLGRIRAALEGSTKHREEEIVRDYLRHEPGSRAAIIAEFGTRVAEYQATVRRVTQSELSGAIAEACSRRKARCLVVPGDVPDTWLPAGIELLRDAPDRPLTNEQLDGSDGVLTGCALGIAQTGTIVLDGGATLGRRAITLLPDYHLCVVREDQIVGRVPEAITLLGDADHSTARPITFISGPSATSDIELSRVEGVHGPRTLEVLLVQG